MDRSLKLVRFSAIVAALHRPVLETSRLGPCCATTASAAIGSLASAWREDGRIHQLTRKSCVCAKPTYVAAKSINSSAPAVADAEEAAGGMKLMRASRPKNT